MREIKMNLAKEANEYLITHGTKEQIEIWHGWWPEDPNDDDYNFIIDNPEHWEFFWTLFGDIMGPWFGEEE